MYPLLIREGFFFFFCVCLCGTEETYKMVRRNARLIPTTENSGLATPLWSDSEFKTLLGEQMDLIVTEKVRQELTQKYEIHPDKTWSVDECKKVLGASIRKNNVKGIICCHREFSVTLATQQSQRNSELEKQNNELRARVSTLTKKLNLKKAAANTDVEVSQPDNIYPDLQAFFETDVALQSVTDVPVNSVNVCGARRRSQGIEETDSVPLNSSVVQIQTVAKALCPKDIERLSQSLPSARTHFSEFRRTLISKMRLYDMSLAEVTQLMSQILTESEFNSFESAVTSELRNASKGDLREGILKILKNIIGPKIDWSRITTCVQRKEETVSEYTERFCQSAVIYSGIVDDPESVLDDKGPLVRIWSDGLVAEYRKALPFLDLTWSNRTLRSNLDRLATNIVIQRAPVTNPSSCMMSAMTEFVLENEGEMTHDCVTLTYAATSEIAETPIEKAELELFVDGSAQVIEGNRRAGYAVTSTTEVVASGRLPDHFSAQAAELVALTRACTLASGSVANIYTDSRYAFGVIHDFGVIWQTRKCLTSAGSPIKHAGLVKDLMFAMKLPKKLAMIKVKAHLTTNTTEAKGNALADVAAKQACFYATVQVCSGSTAQKTILPPESIVDLYKDVPLYEAWTWKGATVDSSGCWTKGGKYVAPKSLLPYLAQQIHSLGHSGPATMNHRFSNQWWNPKFRNAATETVKRCVTCQKNNDVPAATTPAAHTPAPPGPFRHLQVDYISLPPCKGKTDVLVVIDKFSRWVEAYPTGRATAAHTAKCLVTDFIPRWGLPDCIDSMYPLHRTGSQGSV